MNIDQAFARLSRTEQAAFLKRAQAVHDEPTYTVEHTNPIDGEVTTFTGMKLKSCDVQLPPLGPGIGTFDLSSGRDFTVSGVFTNVWVDDEVVANMRRDMDDQIEAQMRRDCAAREAELERRLGVIDKRTEVERMDYGVIGRAAKESVITNVTTTMTLDRRMQPQLKLGDTVYMDGVAIGVVVDMMHDTIDVELTGGAPYDAGEARKSWDSPEQKNEAFREAYTATCAECYGTGYHKGFGAPCSKGCKS